MKQRSLYKFRDWFFDLLIDYLVNSGWVIIIRDFKKSEKRSERNLLGQTNYQEEIIYLDKDCGVHGTRGAPRILVHEICHFGLGVVQEKMSEKLPWKELKKVKGKFRANKEFEWRELRTLEFEKLFYNSLNRRQIKILQGFIDEAQKRYREEEG
ncbi:MAG: hypothetical protein AAB857_01165 [Patescibacteria group bacterium]